MLKIGWQENTIYNSQFFDLKWGYTDYLEDYKTLHEGQYFNHFKNNTELTTKGRLFLNLNNCAYGVNIEEFFPRTFDVGNELEQQTFQSDFEKTALLNLLKSHIAYFKKWRKPAILEAKKSMQQKQMALRS